MVPGVRLNKKRALVIGGSGGIGRAVSLALATEGAEIICHGRRPDRVDATVAACRSVGAAATGIVRDIAGVDDATAVLKEAGPISLLVIAYGPVLYRSLAQTSPAEWTAMALFNLAVPGALVSRALAEMIPRGEGRIVLFGGTDTDRPRGFRTLGAYGAAKSGVSSLVRSAALEAEGHGVAVTAVLPGYVNTEYLTETDREQLRRLSPSGSLDSPESVASVVLRLVLDEVDTVNGTIVLPEFGV